MQKALTMFRFAALFAFTVLLGCRQNTSPGSDAAVTAPESVPAGFVEFYERFHADTAYQVAHIVWPLAGKATETSDSADTHWQRETWRHHKRVTAADGFAQDFQQLGEDLVIERIASAKGEYQLLRRFARLSGGWHLIYYSESLKAG